MDVGPPQPEDAVFSDASLVFLSRDFDAVRQGVARIFKPHLLRLHGTRFAGAHAPSAAGRGIG